MTEVPAEDLGVRHVAVHRHPLVLPVETAQAEYSRLVSHLLHPAHNLWGNLVHVLHSVLNKFHLSRLLVDREAGVSPGLVKV